tara:strand:+ start:182 stop:358 length:177 start_codon:yes stop_codon:yes gene_type:complete
MKVFINFSTDNAAFDRPDDYAEFERIMEELKTTISHNNSGVIHDINGNKIGLWSWVDS